MYVQMGIYRFESSENVNEFKTDRFFLNELIKTYSM